MIIDINKKYRTKSGNKVRVLCVDNEYCSTYPVVVAYESGEVNKYTLNGRYEASTEDSVLDLEEDIPKWKGKLLYNTRTGFVFDCALYDIAAFEKDGYVVLNAKSDNYE